MDSIVSAALEEICTRANAGIPLSELWPSLRSSLIAAGLHPCDAVKKAIWSRLLSLPGLRFESQGSPIEVGDPAIQPLDEAERLELRIIAADKIRDNFLGIYDLKAANAEISAIQRTALERLAAARTNGITQNELAKEFGIKGNNLFYIVKNLECQKLIVRQSTLVREKELGMEGEDSLKNTSIVNTNLLHLYRYAKKLNMNSQRRIEITRPDAPGTSGDAFCEGGASSNCVKNDVLIKDFVPAMRAVCDKLEEASEKVLVVSDIKLALGYRKTPGHRAWRNILNRLKDARLVEEFQAKVDERVVSCLRLLKKFDPNDFQPKAVMRGYDTFDSEHLIKHGKRGQVTDQYVELAVEHCIYDMVDAAGPKGITIPEICKRLGLNAKKLYNRISAMREKFKMPWQAEMEDRTPLYRVWTFRNYLNYKAGNVPGKSEALPDKDDNSAESRTLIPFSGPFPNVQLKDSCSNNELLHSEKADSGALELQLLDNCFGCFGDSQVMKHCKEHQNLAQELGSGDDPKPAGGGVMQNSNAIQSSKHLSVSSIAAKLKSVQKHSSLLSTSIGNLREQRILKKLKKGKFILAVELHKWLEGLEKDKHTTMAKKTLTRILNRLQQEGMCKCIQVSMPGVTNYNRNRTTEVILHPSVETLSSELLDQIHQRHRQFDIQNRAKLSIRTKNNEPVTVLNGVRRSLNVVDDKPVILEAMRVNGFVSAKMVRAKLLHIFLWDYMSNLPDWCNAFNSDKHGYDLKNPNSACQLFSLEEAIKDMPLELFLQVVGSAKKINNMVASCKLGLRLSDLPVQDYKFLMDTHATSRLSCIINILLRLKLIQLVRQQHSEDMSLLPHAVLTHAMELKPYIEEPLSRTLLSSHVKAGLHPRIRHDFVLSKQDAVDDYWETLEYCYAASCPTDASHAFPGSSVREVFLPRAWTSIRVMTTEQRLELLKRVTNVDREKRISFKDCVRIARELNLSVEQVLRASYDRRQSRLCGYSSNLKLDKKGNHPDTDTSGSSARKRKRSSKNRALSHTQENTEENESNKPSSFQSIVEEENIGRANENHESSLPEAGTHSHVSENNSEMHEEDVESRSLINQYALLRRKPIRSKRFLWTDESDRQLVMQYARHRATLGARFYRVDWNSLSDLPTLPDTCRRRMAFLNKNMNIRRAVMRLCNLLGKRYARYLDTARRVKEMEVLFENSQDAESWDNFDDPDIRNAVDEVLQYKRIAKLEYSKKVGSKSEVLSDILPNDERNSYVQQSVSQNEQARTLAAPGERTKDHIGKCKNADAMSTTSRSMDFSHRSHGKFIKLSSNRGLIFKRKVCESLSVANAVELLKLVLLSTAAAPEVQTSLAATLKLYSESDIFAAFNHLKENNFMVVGHGSQPFVLSRKFWHNASSSPFPIDSGKRAADFSNRLRKQEKDLMEDGVNLTSELQCGEVVHLFALVYSGELVISPCLPKGGVGESDEPKSSKPSLEQISVLDDQNILKRKIDKVKLNGTKKVKKHKPHTKIDSGYCSRREKGFPGIQVVLNRKTIPRDGIIQLLPDKESLTLSSPCNMTDHGKSYLSAGTIDAPLMSSSLNSSQPFVSDVQSTKSLDESPWDAMTRYIEILSLPHMVCNEQFTFSADLFRSVHSIIHQAGEQGLSLKEISEAMNLEGIQLAESLVDTLETFRLAIKVNGYDTTRVVDFSYRSKYLISTPIDHNYGKISSYMKSGITSSRESQQLLQEKHDRIYDSRETCLNLSERHKVTILESNPEKIGVTPDGSMQIPSLANREEAGGGNCSAASVTHVSQAILPWINGDGSMNTVVYKGLTRRILGTVMQNPGMMEEDIIRRMDVLNPQSCRRLLEMAVLDNHLIVRTLHQTTSTPPAILQSLFTSVPSKPTSFCRKHFFANPMSTFLL
ncbi:uncharacterized protein [Typha angustifolia]|uniref:uncharacterized protein isoform X1 n=2 Tax=Typha angustifolia TaxID=59011 RepID=UPI003C3059A2